ncbi:MAG TPA: ABC transporter substrate-binding protein [Terriglobales bacterium]|nr:ABC transporter substrate-binding protein [Terriglobales bacterium]
MRLSGFPLLVASSLVLAVAAGADTRPAYGGTLHVSVGIAPRSLDPADTSEPDSIGRRNLMQLMFDTLLTVNSQGRLQPALATAWQAEPGNQRWHFSLRNHVHFHDGSLLTPEAVAASLRTANPGWKVLAAADSVVVECDAPAPDVAAQLARTRNGIAKRSTARNPIGSGPFYITDFQAGKKLALAALENYWGGRAYVDAIEIELGRNGRDQLIALDLGKADIAEVPPEQAQRAAGEGRRLVTSAPVELMALVFAHDPQSQDESKLRQVLALSIDRASIENVVLEGEGEPSGAILPNWVSGYAFVFPEEQNLLRARQLRSEVRQAPAWDLAYDGSDSLARVIAERIALNARDAGILLQPGVAPGAALRLLRIPLASVDPRIALASVAGFAGLPAPRFGVGSGDEIYQAENAMLETHRVIPLFQLPACYVLSPSVQGASQGRAADWHLEDVWLKSKLP